MAATELVLDAIEAVGVVVHSYPYTSRALIDIAGRHHLQVSDALYFHLAKSYGLPLATLDGGLRTACRAHGVKPPIACRGGRMQLPFVPEPERVKVDFDVPPGVELVQEGGRIVLRKIVDVKRFRAAAAEVLKNMPKPKKGADVVRTLEKARNSRWPR